VTPENPDASGSQTTGVLLVMARPPASIGDEEFRAWFKSHLPEILAIPCFVSARLLEIEVFASAPGEELPYRYLAIYDHVGDSASAMAAIGKARAAGDFVLPDWFGEFEGEHYLVSWTGQPA